MFWAASISYLQTFPEVAKNAPQIIGEASKSPLGVLALLALIIGGLGYFFFRKEAWGIRIIIFLVIFFGAFSYGVAVMRIESVATHATRNPDPCVPTQGFSVIAGTIVDAGSGDGIAGADITLVGRNERAVSQSSGNFVLVLPENAKPSDFILRISKLGYDTIDHGVTPPVYALVLQLRKR
jgi:hypothetical protein